MDDSAETEYNQLVSERDFVSLLIELYENRPVLWNTKHPSYLDKVSRARALSEISAQLQYYKPDFTPDKLKKKINIIRSSFNKEKHRVEKKRAQGKEDAQPTLWFFNMLLFLEKQDTPENASSYCLSNAGVSSDAGEAAENENSDFEQKPYTKEERNESPPPERVKRFTNTRFVKRQKVTHEAETEEKVEGPEPEQYMTVTTTYYKKPKRREDLLAETWAMKLKRLATDQKIFAEKIINDVLYEGELGNLTKDGVSFTNFEHMNC